MHVAPAPSIAFIELVCYAHTITISQLVFDKKNI